MMCKGYLSRILTVTLALMPVIASAACDRNEPDWLWNYEGNIGDKYRVKMTLVFGGNTVNGVYFYANQLKDIQLKGRITNGTNIVLDELDAAGKVVARFDGNFPDHNGNKKLECEVIVGTWRNLDTPETLPIYLSWHDSTDGTLKNRYGVAGVRNDSLINQNALLFWNAVKHGDKNTVASFIAYPTKVSISGRMKRINSPKELTANYDAIFSPRYREAITNALPHNMFVNSQGVMLGNGEVWFGSDGKVERLNNDMTGR